MLNLTDPIQVFAIFMFAAALMTITSIVMFATGSILLPQVLGASVVLWSVVTAYGVFYSEIIFH